MSHSPHDAPTNSASTSSASTNGVTTTHVMTAVPPVIRVETDAALHAGELGPIGARPPLAQYLREIWARRHFMWMDARSRVVTKNSQYKLGMRWLVLRPLLDAAFYFLIFGVILQVHRGMENFAAYVVIGILMFQFTARSLTSGARLITSNSAVIKAFAFPKASLAVAYILRELLGMIPVIAVTLAVIMALPPHEVPEWAWFGVLPLLAVQAVLNLGIVLLAAAAGFAWPDTAQLLNFLTRILMYASAVIFPIDRFIDRPAVMAVIEANPVYQLIAAYRLLLMDGGWPPLETWATLCAWAAGLLILGFVVFWWNEARYVRD